MRQVEVQNQVLLESFIISLYKSFNKLCIYNDEQGKVILNTPIKLEVRYNNLTLFVSNSDRNKNSYIKALEWSIEDKESFVLKNVSISNSVLKDLTNSIASLYRDISKGVMHSFEVNLDLYEIAFEIYNSDHPIYNFLEVIRRGGHKYRFIQLRDGVKFITDQVEVERIRNRFISKVKLLLARLIVKDKHKSLYKDKYTFTLTFDNISISNTLIDVTYLVKIDGEKSAITVDQFLVMTETLNNLIKDLRAILMNIKQDPIEVSISLDSASDLLFI